MFLHKTGTLTGTEEQLAALFICRTSQLQLALQQLKAFKVAEIIEQNGNIIVTCRRTERQYGISELRRKAGVASGTKRQQTSQRVYEHPSPSPSTSSSQGEMQEGGMLTEKEALAQCNGVLGIPEDFAKFVYQDWDSRSGRDAGNVSVPWPKYVKKRWEREQAEWRNGSHKGRKAGIASGPNLAGKDIARRARQIDNFDTSLPDQ